ncbi:MAG: D-alanyl-D-alanine carboxypeptidase family protein [Blastocatellia bacterium]|nr:D-alanyl-D-alanine carboxypeptidase family protein [Blastocatellia bacterium]
MLNVRVYSGLFVLFVAILIAVSLRGDAAVQSGKDKPAKQQANEGDSLVRLSAPAGTDADVESTASVFSSASLQNLRLQTDLNWFFGGKSQRGWELYVPLISSLIGTDADVRSGRFALALSRWQQANQLEPDGILDDATLYRIIETFQSRRIKERVPPPEDHLLTAPASDFYHPSRPEELRKVERQTYLAYKRMVRAAIEDPSLGLSVTADGDLALTEKYLKIISAYRSREYQAELRKKSPGSGRAGLAFNSPHFTGRALDIYVGGTPVSTAYFNRAIQVQMPAYRWLVKNAARFGFRPYFYEPWHWEYTPNVSHQSSALSHQ